MHFLTDKFIVRFKPASFQSISYRHELDIQHTLTITRHSSRLINVYLNEINLCMIISFLLEELNVKETNEKSNR
jgi:hypothetical protein